MPTDPYPADNSSSNDPPAIWTAPGQDPFVKKGQFVPGNFKEPKGEPHYTDPVAPGSPLV